MITITHLPQIAALADRHFRVEKIPGDPTHTRIEQLDDGERRAELERMLGGQEFLATYRAAQRPRRCSPRVEDVWAFLAEPYHLADWWPGIAGIDPDRRGFAPGARWRIRASDVLPSRPFIGVGLLKRPGASGILLVTEVVTGRRIAFQLVSEGIDVELELEQAEGARTRVGLVVEAGWRRIRRSYPHRALARLYDLVQTGAEPA